MLSPVTAGGTAGLTLSLTGAALVVMGGLGHRLGWWGYRAGFALLASGVLLGLTGIALSIAAVLRSGPRLVPALAGVVVGLAAVAVPLRWLVVALRVPPIHDVTTDLDDPPEFVAVLPLRANAPNPAAHGGPAVAEHQRRAYPDIAPLAFPVAPDVAFARAIAAAHAMGWTIVGADPSAGRIEASTTTPWFGFTDDVVVRVSPTEGGSVVDMRSVSRVGRSDMGANAKRIRAFLRRLQEGS